MDDRSLLSIGQFAEATGLSVKALRLYDRRGLLKPATVDLSSGYRYYAPNQVALGRAVHFMRTLRMPLEEIRALLIAAGEEGEILERHRARLRAEIAARRRALSQIPGAEEWTSRKEGEMSNRHIECSFCGKSHDQVERVIAGPKAVYICNECVALCNEILEDEQKKASGQ